MKNILILLTFFFLLISENLAFAEIKTANSENAICKGIVHSGKTFAYLADEKFNAIKDQIDFGDFYESKDANGFYSAKPIYVVASKDLVVGDPLAESRVSAVKLVPKKMGCKNVNIFDFKFVIFDPEFWGEGGKVDDFPRIVLIDKEGHPFEVPGPKKVLGNVRMYKLDFFVMNSPNHSSTAIVDPKSGAVTTLTLINDGNIAVKMSNWRPSDSKGEHWVKIFENQCADHELQPKDICTMKFRWGDVKTLEDWQVWMSKVELNNGTIRMDLKKQKDDSYELKIAEEIVAE